jgi:DNA-binding NarL/FixJ family response regulator
VDDHEVVRGGVRSLLLTQRDLDVCGEAGDGRDAIDKARMLLLDLVLMDFCMPNLNGFEAAREIRRMLPQSEVIILSQHETSQMVTQAFRAGALGDVVKSSDSKTLFALLEEAGRHETFCDPSITNSMVLEPGPNQSKKNSRSHEPLQVPAWRDRTTC